MRKLIVYSLFDHDGARRFERLAYWRGIYFNWRMNRLIYPEWEMRVSVDTDAQAEYLERIGIACHQLPNPGVALGEGMLRRVMPVWELGVDRILCRDADAVTTYREAQFVQAWEASGRTVHVLHDHPHHVDLMGGMIGIRCARFRALTGIPSFEALIAGWDLSGPYSDQPLLNARVLPRVAGDIQIDDARASQPSGQVHGIPPSLRESNLTCPHIGSAGVIELELLRFFERHDPRHEACCGLESELKDDYPDVFYWADSGDVPR